MRLFGSPLRCLNRNSNNPTLYMRSLLSCSSVNLRYLWILSVITLQFLIEPAKGVNVLLHFNPFNYRFRDELAVGRPCQETIECGQGAYCAGNQLCACLSTFVDVNGFCWPKINPGQTGCTHDKQCSASWPAAVCQNGECKCSNGQPPFETRDGPVCLTYGFCPINGEVSKLKDNAGNPVGCPAGLDDGCPITYDCICGKPDCPNDSGAFCCPGRSIACILPLDLGSFLGSGSTLNRWHHNPATGECDKFAYRGLGGNANNFESKEHCESYCKQNCPQGMPQYEPPSFPSTKQKQLYCSSSSVCKDQYECSTAGTLQFCCPKITFICSKQGGIVYPTGSAPHTNYDPGSTGGNSVTYPRYYYDESQKRCLPFVYRGQEGNFNNFASQADCDQVCAKTVCEAGEPLKDTSGVRNLICIGNEMECPATHFCNNGVCCPTKQAVCKLPKLIGFCNKSFVKRWFFNASAGTCEEFTYSGCHGNANNFESYKTCTSYCRNVRVEPNCPHGRPLKDSHSNFVYCGAVSDQMQTQSCPINYQCYFDGKTYGCCPTQSHTCTLNFDQGSQCGPTVSRWYFDNTKRVCSTFEYFGCDGNSNNFATQQDCKEYCHVESCPEGGEIYTDVAGNQKSCLSSSDCPNTHFCTEISKWTNGAWKSVNYCCPNRIHVCMQYKHIGNQCSSSPLKRYWFNIATRNCEEFTYNGCGGNRNNFPSLKSCTTYCMASACPAGTVAHQNGQTEQLTNCEYVTGIRSSGCPQGFGCFNASQLLRQNVCCGNPPGLEDVCPGGSYPYLDTLGLQPQACTPNIDSSCPPGFFCSYNTNSATATYYCCRNRILKEKEINFIDTENKMYLENITSVATTLPSVEPLHRTSFASSQMYRPMHTSTQMSRPLYTTSAAVIDISQSENVCPPTLAAIEEGNGFKYCSPTASLPPCGSGNSCQWGASIKRFICCGAESKTFIDVVPPDRYTEVYAKSVNTPSMCPPVPPGLVPQKDDSGEYKKCKIGSTSITDTCIDKGVCLYTTVLNRYICCAPEQKISDSGGKEFKQKSISDCDNAPGFFPVEPFQPCSPFVTSSCGASVQSNTQCIYSSTNQQYLCCKKILPLKPM